MKQRRCQQPRSNSRAIFIDARAASCLRPAWEEVIPVFPVSDHAPRHLIPFIDVHRSICCGRTFMEKSKESNDYNGSEQADLSGRRS